MGMVDHYLQFRPRPDVKVYSPACAGYDRASVIASDVRHSQDYMRAQWLQVYVSALLFGADIGC